MKIIDTNDGLILYRISSMQSIDEVRYKRHGITRAEAYNQDNWIDGFSFEQSGEAKELWEKNKE